MAKNYKAKDWLGDVLLGMASGASGQRLTPMYQAQAAGMPEGAGVSPEIFRAMMGERRAGSKQSEAERLLTLKQLFAAPKQAAQIAYMEKQDSKGRTGASLDNPLPKVISDRIYEDYHIDPVTNPILTPRQAQTLTGASGALMNQYLRAQGLTKDMFGGLPEEQKPKIEELIKRYESRPTITPKETKGKGKKYNTPEDVKNDNSLSYEQKKKILQKDFGMK